MYRSAGRRIVRKVPEGERHGGEGVAQVPPHDLTREARLPGPDGVEQLLVILQLVAGVVITSTERTVIARHLVVEAPQGPSEGNVASGAGNGAVEAAVEVAARALAQCPGRLVHQRTQLFDVLVRSALGG